MRRNPIYEYERSLTREKRTKQPIIIVESSVDYKSPEVKRGFLEKWHPKIKYNSIVEILNDIKYVDIDLYQEMNQNEPSPFEESSDKMHVFFFSRQAGGVGALVMRKFTKNSKNLEKQFTYHPYAFYTDIFSDSKQDQSLREVIDDFMSKLR